MRYVELDGKRYAMRDIHAEYKRQRDEERRQRQLTLFELREDHRPSTQLTARDRHENPQLFER